MNYIDITKNIKLIQTVNSNLDKLFKIFDYHVFKKDHNYAILKFNNHSSKKITKITFELSEYHENEFIQKNTYQFDNIQVLRQTRFVPEYKFLLSKDTTKIDLKVVSLETEHETYLDNAWVKKDLEIRQNESKIFKLSKKDFFKGLWVSGLMVVIFFIFLCIMLYIYNLGFEI